MQLSQEYDAQPTLEGKVSVLQKHYRLEKVDIEAENVAGFLGLSGIARLSKSSKGYKISVIGKHYVNYLSLHEFLHIWLEETRRTFSVEQKDKSLEEYLFCLKNMFNDYLIETEVKRQFGEDYAFMCKALRDYDLRGQFMGGALGGAPASPLTKFMLLFTCGLVSEVYPSMADSFSKQFFGCVNWGGKGEFMAIPQQYKPNVSPEQYLDGINSLNHALTGSELTFVPNGQYKTVKFDNPFIIKKVLTNFNKEYENIIGALKRVYGIGQCEDTVSTPDNVRTLTK